MNNEGDIIKLQSDGLTEWCNENDLHIKLNKCAVMSITNKMSVIIGHYRYDDHIFKRELNSNISFTDHANYLKI